MAAEGACLLRVGGGNCVNPQVLHSSVFTTVCRAGAFSRADLSIQTEQRITGSQRIRATLVRNARLMHKIGLTTRRDVGLCFYLWHASALIRKQDKITCREFLLSNMQGVLELILHGELT